LPAGAFDVVIVVGCGDEGCGRVPARRRETWNIPDPKDLSREDYRKVRDLIERKVRELLTRL
jgi:arsenate reductase